ncbi:hypothetical protein [Thalassospira sp.]|mgnify:FL=1|uniref:hypothetical protein n=1 Tax=Thalassospira sp. TaxID=1912094 RepID=UPI000C4D5AEC|nr:hypothetical protein [Thalassospira sp.]MAL41425.1 hypothetical protein [Thalassospira sp.]MBR9900444.1 hypothetical protein [Rhodospirillales bacterium]|tara:strand:+ start:1879 stop:2082 length:204 start_codon:yes stop_codon:yes gene_type:complete
MVHSLYVTTQDDFKVAFCAMIENANDIEQVMHLSRQNKPEIETMDPQLVQMMRTAVANRLHYLGYKR